jgi:hypothetical protein
MGGMDWIDLAQDRDRRRVLVNALMISIQINHQSDATISPVFSLTFIYNSTCFGRPSAHHQELDHDQQHCYHQAPKLKPEAATAVVELLMLGARTPETC